MSGSRAITLSLTVRDADVVRRQLEAMGSAGEAALKRLDAAAQAASKRESLGGLPRVLQEAGTQADRTSSSMGVFRNAVQQGGYQLQDFTVQVQGGTSALVALSQQGSQFLGIFGPAGAIAGAALAIGTVAAGFLTAANNAGDAEKAATKAFDEMSRAAANTRSVLSDVNQLFLSVGQRAAVVANLSRQQSIDRLTEGRAGITSQQWTAERQLVDAQAELERLQRFVANEERTNARVRAGGGMVPDGESDTNTRALDAARLRVQSLQSELARTREQISEVDAGIKRLGSIQYGAEEFGPTSADPTGADALRASLDRRAAAQQAYRAKVNEINQAVREGAIDAAEGERLAALAVRERDEAIKRLGETAKSTAGALRNLVEVQDADGNVFTRDASVQRRLDSFRAAADREQEQKDRRAAQAREKLEREEQATRQKMERDAERSVDAISGYVGDAFADVFLDTAGGWDRMWSRMQRVAIAALARMAAEAAIRPIIQSVVFSGQGGASGGLGTVGQMLGGGGSGLNYSSIAGGVRSLGGTLSGQGSTYNTGIGWLDGGLNSTAYYTGSAAVADPMAQGMGMGGYTGGAGAVTYGQALQGGLGVVGGAYGIYSGLQRGGAGGYTQAASGALATTAGAATLVGSAAPYLAALGPYAAVGAAILAIASAFLPGQRPSDMTQTYRMTLDNGFQAAGGLGGARFSDENAQSARQIATGISELAAALRSATGATSTPYAFEVGVGNRDGISLFGGPNGTRRNYARTEQGQQQLVQDATNEILAAMRGQFSAEVRQIVDRSGGNTEQLFADLDWYKTVFQPLSQVTQVTNLFQQALDQLAATYDPAIEKARSLGLATNELSARQAEATTRLYEERAANDRNTLTGFDVRFRRAIGMDQEAALMEYNLSTDQEWRSYARSLQEQGFNPEEIAARTRYFENVQAQERLAIIRQFSQEAVQAERQAADARLRASGEAAGVISSLADYASSLRYSDASPLSLQDRFGAAQNNFDELFRGAMGGDAASLRRFQGASQDYLSIARELYGSTGGYADAFNRVQNGLGSLGGLNDNTLTASFQAEIVQTQTQTLVDAIGRLQSEVAAQRRELAQIAMRPAA